MRDPDIRAELHRRLRRLHEEAEDVRIVDEMGVLTGECRIDVAVINGRLEGFKSERDSLDRLPHQAEAYGRIFDRLTLVCAERHLEKALATVPGWWGVEVAKAQGEAVKIIRVRTPRANRALDSRAIAQLLWREETLGALEELGAAKGLRSKPRAALWTALAEEMPARDLRTLVRNRLRARSDWLAAG
jgi:hypothetical protein